MHNKKYLNQWLRELRIKSMADLMVLYWGIIAGIVLITAIELIKQGVS